MRRRPTTRNRRRRARRASSGPARSSRRTARDGRAAQVAEEERVLVESRDPHVELGEVERRTAGDRDRPVRRAAVAAPARRIGYRQLAAVAAEVAAPDRRRAARRDRRGTGGAALAGQALVVVAVPGDDQPERTDRRARRIRHAQRQAHLVVAARAPVAPQARRHGRRRDRIRRHALVVRGRRGRRIGRFVDLQPQRLRQHLRTQVRQRGRDAAPRGDRVGDDRRHGVRLAQQAAPDVRFHPCAERGARVVLAERRQLRHRRGIRVGVARRGARQEIACVRAAVRRLARRHGALHDGAVVRGPQQACGEIDRQCDDGDGDDAHAIPSRLLPF